MATVEYLDLKNSAEVCGIVTENAKGFPITLTEELVENIAKAFCVWLISHTGKVKVNVALGYDGRPSSPSLCEAAVKGITATGHDAVVTDISATPIMQALLQDDAWKETYPCDGALMFTTDAAEGYYNGLNFFYVGGKLSVEHVRSILDIATTYRYNEPSQCGKRTEVAYLDNYAEGLLSLIRLETGDETPLLNKKIVIHANNDMGNFFAEKVLFPLGADIGGAEFVKPAEGALAYFPCDYTAEDIEALSDAIKAMNADMGIFFSGSANNICIVDQAGNPFLGNRFIALISAIYLSEKEGTIVTDSITSNGLTKFIEARGGIQHRYMCGMQNIVEAAIRLNRIDEYSPLAIDTNSKAAMLANDFREDGLYTIAQVLIAFVKASKNGQALSDLVADLELSKEALAVEIPFVDPNGTGFVNGKTLHEFYNYASRTPYITVEEENYEGYRVNYDEKHGNGWVLLYANQNAMLSIHVESDSEHGAIKMAKDVYYFLKKCPYVDVAPLKDAIDAERARLIANIRKDFYSDAAYLAFIFGEKTIVQDEDIPQAVETAEPVEETAPSATAEEITTAETAEN